MLVGCAAVSAVLLSLKANSFEAFAVELTIGLLVPCGAVIKLQFHGVIKFHGAVVAYVAANGAKVCPKGRCAWGVNADSLSAAAVNGDNPPSVSAATRAWEMVTGPGISDVPMLIAVGENNVTASEAVCTN